MSIVGGTVMVFSADISVNCICLRWVKMKMFVIVHVHTHLFEVSMQKLTGQAASALKTILSLFLLVYSKLGYIGRAVPSQLHYLSVDYNHVNGFEMFYSIYLHS
jgi:hypothetical protein